MGFLVQGDAPPDASVETANTADPTNITWPEEPE